jgi:hypothetical protein
MSVRNRYRASLLLLALLSLGALLPAQAAAHDDGRAPKVALIVGPVGEALTPTYIAIADAAAAAAEAGGARVAKAYSPDATPDKVLEAVENANIVVYLGHNVGTPNPYGPGDPAVVNGWGLQGPRAHGTHEDSWKDGTLAYYGEAWIAQHARPAPGWVMIYSNACYAPGASEGFDTPATPEVAQQRVSAYARAPLDELGASAYFATDFYEGAARLISTMLAHPDWSYGDIYRADPNYLADGLATLPDAAVANRQVWLQDSPYFEGKTEYWYAFSGDPQLTPASTLLSGMAPSLEGWSFGPVAVLAPAHAGTPVELATSITAVGPGRLPSLTFQADWTFLTTREPVTDFIDIGPVVSTPASLPAEQSLPPRRESTRLDDEAILGSVPAPGLPGLYSLDIRLLAPDGTPIAGTEATYEESVNAVIDATYEAPSELAVPSGEIVEVPVIINNIGAAAWGSGSVGRADLVASWDTPSVAPSVVASVRQDQSSGARASTTLRIMAPQEAGVHVLRIEVVTEHLGSLLAHGVPPAVVLVTVAAAQGAETQLSGR